MKKKEKFCKKNSFETRNQNMSHKVQFQSFSKSNTISEPQKNKTSLSIKNSLIAKLTHVKKEWMINLLLRKKWSSQTKTQLNKLDSTELKEKISYCIIHKATMSDIQQVEEGLNKERKEQKDLHESKLNEKRERRDYYFRLGKQTFLPGSVVWIFDEKPTPNKELYPLKARVLFSEGKTITVEFTETRPWYESGGHRVYKGQQMKFIFDYITCMWLREGMTAEVTRSISSNGKSIYFELPNTRQYLLYPSIK